MLVAHPSPDLYGADLQLLESVAGFVADGWAVVVVLPEDGPLVARLRTVGAVVRFTGFPVLKRANSAAGGFARMVAEAVTSLPRLVALVRQVRASVVLVNTITLPWWLLAGRLARRPVACHVHEAETEDRRFVRQVLTQPLRLADRLVVNSRAATHALTEVVPALEAKISLVYNGVPEPPHAPTPAHLGEHGLGERGPGEPLRLAVVGRLSPRKAPHVAIAATGILRAAGHPVELEIAGSAADGYSWYEQELVDQAAAAELGGAVTFSGYAAPIWPVLDRVDVVLAPSLREPFGNAVVEAQLACRPVVASAALGHLETVADGETGLLVRPDDAEAMAAAVERLIADPQFADELAAEARDRARQRFSTARYRAEMVKVVSDLLD
ncbi:MAG: glycosyltransferase family 4 protein [Propionibacteriaceae bacterium]